MKEEKINNTSRVCEDKRNLTRKLFPLLFFLLAGLPVIFAQPFSAAEPIALISSADHNYSSAVWSPGGQTIAFTSDKQNGIWLANADGSNLRLLTADHGVGFGFSWSPDGEYILARSVVTENRRRFHQVKVYEVSSGAYEIIQDKTRDLQGVPFWSNQQVALVMDRQLELRKPQLVNKNNTSSTLVDLQSSMVSYHFLDKIHVMNKATRQSERIADFEGRIIFNMRPSPSGNKLVFQLQGLGLHVVNADGTGLKNLGQGERASWMPGEKYVVVSLVEDNGYVITGGELYVVDVNTGESVHLTPHTQLTALKPAVSPCGTKVLFDNPDDGTIYLMELR